MTLSTNIQAVLFDADGVLQKPVEGWRDRLAAFSGSTERHDEFMRDFFEAEMPCLTGDSDFADVLADILVRWNSPFCVEEVARRSNVEVDFGVVEIVQALKRSGIRCYLTTNQHEYRAQYMSEELDYGTIFDGEFYSCRVGYKKPATEYFNSVLDAVALPPEEVLFIDDGEPNMAAAQGLGTHIVLFEAGAGAGVLGDILQQFGIEVRSHSTT